MPKSQMLLVARLARGILTNPGLAFTEVGKALGEKWKKMSAEEKEAFEIMAKADSKRYREQMAGYKSGAAANV